MVTWHLAKHAKHTEPCPLRLRVGITSKTDVFAFLVFCKIFKYSVDY